jgi:hypothetical protein
LNNSWDFDALITGLRKRGRFTVEVPSAGDRKEADMLDANNVKAKVNPSIKDVLWRSGEWKVQCLSLYRLLGFGTEGEVWDVIAFKVTVDG